MNPRQTQTVGAQARAHHQQILARRVVRCDGYRRVDQFDQRSDADQRVLAAVNHRPREARRARRVARALGQQRGLLRDGRCRRRQHPLNWRQRLAKVRGAFALERCH